MRAMGSDGSNFCGRYAEGGVGKDGGVRYVCAP
jgi:hypothetical protein